MSSFLPTIKKRRQVVLFSSTAIALYGYDQGGSSPNLFSVMCRSLNEKQE
jgi:hypothetical protein